MTLFIKKIKTYAELPEMRLFWILLPIVLSVLIISFFYLPLGVNYFTAGLFVFVLAIVLVNNLRLAHSNLEIKVERNELGSIINNLDDGIMAYDTDFKVVIFNSAAEAIFDMPAKEVVGKIFSPDSSHSLKSQIFSQAMFPSLAPTSVLRSDPDSSIQVVDLSFNEPRLELRVTSVKITDPAKKVLGFLKIFRDRTREVEILKSKSEFITIAAHQLRTPLSAIGWTFETLEQEPGLTPDGKTFVENGNQAAKKVLKIVNDLLDVSKIEEGRFGYQTEEIDLVGFLENILKQAAAFAAEYGVAVYFEKPAEGQIRVVADSVKLAIAVNNLIDNAIKYNVKNGNVTVGISKIADGSFIQVTIKDTGLGIEKEDLGKIFGKFFRAENALHAETSGSGLGLYIAKNIITHHGGKIWVESEPNRGATFYFTLPTDPALIKKRETDIYA